MAIFEGDHPPASLNPGGKYSQRWNWIFSIIKIIWWLLWTCSRKITAYF